MTTAVSTPAVMATSGVTVVVACTDYALGKVADMAIPISDAARGQMAAAGEVVMNA